MVFPSERLPAAATSTCRAVIATASPKEFRALPIVTSLPAAEIVDVPEMVSRPAAETLFEVEISSDPLDKLAALAWVNPPSFVRPATVIAPLV